MLSTLQKLYGSWLFSTVKYFDYLACIRAHGDIPKKHRARTNRNPSGGASYNGIDLPKGMARIICAETDDVRNLRPDGCPANSHSHYKAYFFPWQQQKRFYCPVFAINNLFHSGARTIGLNLVYKQLAASTIPNGKMLYDLLTQHTIT
jgi:hypothetical protein